MGHYGYRFSSPMALAKIVIHRQLMITGKPPHSIHMSHNQWALLLTEHDYFTPASIYYTRSLAFLYFRLKVLVVLTFLILSFSWFHGSWTLVAKLLFLIGFLSVANVLRTSFSRNLLLPAPSLASSIFQNFVLSNLSWSYIIL